MLIDLSNDRLNHEPLFEVPSEEDLGFDSERTLSPDENKGRISSISSSHGSIESSPEETGIAVMTIHKESNEEGQQSDDIKNSPGEEQKTEHFEGIQAHYSYY